MNKIATSVAELYFLTKLTTGKFPCETRQSTIPNYVFKAFNSQSRKVGIFPNRTLAISRMQNLGILCLESSICKITDIFFTFYCKRGILKCEAGITTGGPDVVCVK